MNYYPFHIGDYLSATRHLSWDEDAAYRRLLDVYYTNERPLPNDERAIFRLVLATSVAQREAVKTVLQEFFELTDAGWINSRCDDEIEVMREKQKANEERDLHERERMRRHRERRSVMFEALRAVGVVAPWDINIKELQRLHDQHCNVTETDLQREQVVTENATATAIPIPTPTPIPTPKSSEAPKARASKRCPETFELTYDMHEWATANAPLVDIELATAKFKDHTFKTGITDWKAAWRNWLRNEQQYAGTRTATVQQRETFKERDERLAREKWEQVTGRRQLEPLTIDVEQPPILALAGRTR